MSNMKSLFHISSISKVIIKVKVCLPLTESKTDQPKLGSTTNFITEYAIMITMTNKNVFCDEVLRQDCYVISMGGI